VKESRMQARHGIERLSRAHATSTYCGDHTALCRVLGQYKMYVDTRDVSLAPHLMLNGFWESWVTKAIAEHIRPGMVCADVGANFGYFTLVMADRAGPTGHVYAFEANPRLADLLTKTIDVNGYLDRVTIIPKAVSDVPGDVLLKLSADHMGGSTIQEKTPICKIDEGVTVQAVALDDVIDQKIDFIKADIEGAELKMLDGMKRLWEDHRPTLCVEYSPGFYSPRAALPLRLRDMGCKIQIVEGDGALGAFSLEKAASMRLDAVEMLWAT
jgi:FkbM family methyltransferase